MTGVGSTPRNLQTILRDINKRLVAQERRRVNGATWDRISDKPTTFPPSPHTHDWDTGVTDKPTTFPPSAHTHDWDAGITGKPSTFPPSSHTHDWGTGITGKPSSFPPSTHQHAATDITSGTLPVARGGTGVTSNPSLLVNLASTAADSVFETSPRPGVTGTLPVTQGGTGQTTVAGVKSAFGVTAAENRLAALEGRKYASGTTATQANAYTTVTLPSGLFSSAPQVVASNGSQGTVGVSRIVNKTSSSFQIGIWSLAGAWIAGSGIDWIATG